VAHETLIFAAGALGLAVVASLVSMFFSVAPHKIAIVQRFGSFLREAKTGLHVKVPFIDRVIAQVDTQGQTADDLPQSSEGTYLPALVGLVDQLTLRLIVSERALAIAERERDDARAVVASEPPATPQAREYQVRGWTDDDRR
jgi:regulator of protease activity HflC (stomatin/prohibitin superfamily)